MKRRASTWACLVAASIAAPACGDASESAPSGLEEPLIVTYLPVNESKQVAAQFFRGEMPTGQDGPSTTITNRQSAIFPGTAGKRIDGNAGLAATSVMLRLEGLGSGYWVIPTLTQDQDLKGTMLWQAQMAFSRNLPPGRKALRAVAVDAEGHFGQPAEIPLVVQPLVPGGAVVANLVWDSNADLDLQIITPSGKQIDAKHPATAPKSGGAFPPGTGVLDRDSNGACVIDSIRQENLVWTDFPTETGVYLAKVDMFSACGEPAANFAFRIYMQGEPTEPIAGRLLSIDADNGGPGLAIANFKIEP